MEQHQQRHQEKHAEKIKFEAATASADVKRCANCGEPLPPGARFCENCGAPQGANRCVSCGAEVPEGTAICPVCGRPATTTCTFCGSEMSAGEAFCPECGNARGGIVCPQCNTLNFRSFCRKCNYPLNPMARYALEEARRDPRYIKAQAIADELDTLEEEIARLEKIVAQGPAVVIPPPPQPERVLEIDDTTSNSTARLMEEFRKLSGAGPAQPKAAPARPQAKAAEPAAKPVSLSASKASGGNDISLGGTSDPSFGATAARLEQLKKQYAAKADELQKALDAMVPPADAPAEIKRNFACAHRITTRVTETTVERERVCWICNRCHVRHNNPSECCVAEYGGKWVTKEVLRTITRGEDRTILL